MGDPDFLNHEFKVKTEPPIVLLNSLIRMMMLTDRAALFVRGENRFQILATVPNSAGCAILDMESGLISAPPNADVYSLQFLLGTWTQRLWNFIMQDSNSSLLIFKMPGTTDLNFSFGITDQIIPLGQADFVKSNPIHMDDHPCLLRVTMRADAFRRLIQSFDSIHDHTVSAVQLHITRETISWVTPSTGNYDHFRPEFETEGLEEGAVFKFGVRWDQTLFEMLCSVAVVLASRVVVSVFRNTLGEKLYRFQFYQLAETYCFSYIEPEFEPVQ